jgi:hypothetical protein
MSGGIAPASAGAQPDQPRLPELTGQSVFRWSEWRALDGAPLASVSPFVQPQGGQEIALRIHDVKPGAYYLRVCVETGANTGEEELANTDSAMLFLNGKAVSFGRATPIVPFGKTNVAVIESARPISVQNGDEIRWNVARRPENTSAAWPCQGRHSRSRPSTSPRSTTPTSTTRCG